MPRVTGRTVSVVVSVRAKRKSLQVKRNVKSAAVIKAFVLTGSTTERKVRSLPAPSARAASMISLGMFCMNERRTMMAKGTPAVESARISPR